MLRGKKQWKKGILFVFGRILLAKVEKERDKITRERTVNLAKEDYQEERPCLQQFWKVGGGQKNATTRATPLAMEKQRDAVSVSFQEGETPFILYSNSGGS